MPVHTNLSYPIFIGDKALSGFSEWLRMQTNYSQILLLVDENTLRHCVPDLITEVSELEGVEFLEIEPGEDQKNIEVATQLWMTLSELNIDRKALIINVGGGVIGDLGGFVASAFKRGIDFIQVPTTLLAMIDASVGGKVGIDLGELKNQIGFFSEPAAVVIYPPFLDSLDVNQVKSGYAEMIKHGLIVDKTYFEELKKFDLHVTQSLIDRSVNIKSEIVLNDFKEQEKRKLLNFGHTFGHAFESYFLANGNPILHGMAVAAGMICEVLMSKEMNLLSEHEANEVVTFLNNHYQKLPVQPEEKQAIFELMKMDKKNSQGIIKSVALTKIGEAIFDVEVTEQIVFSTLDQYINL
jgi:3-dehydroquinate synthase